jgi:hypothetical protein
MSDEHNSAPTQARPESHRVTPKARLAASLRRVREVALQEHRSDLAAAVAQELKHLQHASEVTVVVAAEVSRGKSLLINALVDRENLLPVDIDVSTGVYVVVKHSASAEAQIFTRAAPDPIPAAVDALADWVSVANNPGNTKDVSYVEVGIPSPLLREGVLFIDTPGVGGLDAEHGATTLQVLSDADALIFVLAASEPLSRPELTFLVKAAERIDSVILVMTKTDVFQSWMTILDENRQLLQKYAPRFAEQDILRLRTPLFFEAEKRRASGDTAAADWFLARSGIPALIEHLRDDVLQRANTIKITNGRRLALSVLRQLDAGYEAQLSTLSGDTTPLRALRRRQRALAEMKNSTEGWRQAATRAFAKVNTNMNRELQEEMVNFRSKFDTKIATDWHRGEHLSFPAVLEADLHVVELSLQRRLAESLQICAGEQAARLGIEELSVPATTLELKQRDRLSARPVSKGTAQLAVIGSGLLSGGFGILKSLIGFNPIYALSGVLGVGMSLHSLRSHRLSAEQTEARRLLREYAERFQRDCKAAIDDAVHSATETVISALQQRIQSSLATLRQQIKGLTEQAAQVKEAEATKALVAAKRTAVTELIKENEAALRAISGTAPGHRDEQTARGSVAPADGSGRPEEAGSRPRDQAVEDVTTP